MSITIWSLASQISSNTYKIRLFREPNDQRGKFTVPFFPGVWKITGSCDIFQEVQLQRFEGNGISIFGIIVRLSGA